MWNRLLAVLFFLSFVSSPILFGQRIYLVTAGVSNYPGVENDLYLPANDAKAMHRLYKKNSSATSVLLTNANATKRHILDEMKRVFSKARPNDIVVLYFSGHGAPGGFVAYDGFILYDEIREVFGASNARNKMIFADACFAGDIREEERLGYVESKNNIMLFLSCRSNEYSLESRSMKNGYFTACLVRAMKGGADSNRDRVITALELFQAVNPTVAELTEGRQHPVMWGNFSNNMPVMVWK